jgi:opine dehydrogenase
MEFLVIGGGPVGHAVLASCIRHGATAYGYSRSGHRLNPVGAIEARGAFDGNYEPKGCFRDFHALIRQAGTVPKWIFVCCPATELSRYAELLAPYLESDHSVFLVVSGRFDDLFFRSELRANGVRSMPRVASSMTTPFTSKFTGEILNILAEKGEVPFFCENADISEAVRLDLNPYLPALTPVQSALGMALDKLQETTHFPLTIGNWSNLERGLAVRYYRDNATGLLNMCGELDAERVAVARACGVETLTFVEVQQIEYPESFGFTTAEVISTTRAYDTIVLQNVALADPNNFFVRRCQEDWGCNGVPLQALARLAGVSTPVLDSYITQYERLFAGLGNSLQPGWTLERLAPGVNNLDEFIRLVG